MTETKNAIIEAATITNDDHGVLSAWVTLDYGGSAQGFWGYVLYSPGELSRTQGNYAGHFIWRVMEIAGVSQWNQLKGKTVRVRGSRDGVEAIGHIVKDKWFFPEMELAQLRGEARRDE